MTTSPRRRRWVVALVAGLALVVPANAAGADTKDDKSSVVEKRAKLASQLDVLKADDNQLNDALDALDASVTSTTGELGKAQASERKAVLEAAKAENEAQAASAELDLARQAIVGDAVASYMDPSGHDLGAGVQPDGSDVDINKIARRLAYARIQRGLATDALDQLRAARIDLDAKRGRAKALAKTRAAAKAATEGRLLKLNAAKDRQGKVQDQVEQKIAAARDGISTLDALDSQLNAKLRAEDAQNRARAASLGPDPSSSSGAGTGTGGIPLRTVGGITVNAAIADQVGALLGAAAAAGVRLGGGGYRDPSQQIALRRQNCGGDVYGRSASSCHPPTAKPGTSMHEKGLAIDFTYNGAGISSHSNPGYQWMRGNAARYGLYNLPSEPWHWSTNGN